MLSEHLFRDCSHRLPRRLQASHADLHHIFRRERGESDGKASSLVYESICAIRSRTLCSMAAPPLKFVFLMIPSPPPRRKMWRRRVRRRLLCHSKRKRTPSRMSFSFWSGQRGSNSLPAIPRMAVAIRRTPGSPRIRSRLRRGGGGSEFGGTHRHPKRKRTPSRMSFSFWSGQRGSNSLPAIPRMAVAIRRTPGSPRIRSRLRRGGGGSEFGGTHRHPKRKRTPSRMSFSFGAGNEARTRFPPSREWLLPFARTPGSPRIRSRLRRGGGGSEFGGTHRHPKRKRTPSRMSFSFWSGQRGSNSLPPPWQGGALPDELCPRNKRYFNREIPACQASSSRFSAASVSEAPDAAPSPSAEGAIRNSIRPTGPAGG